MEKTEHGWSVIDRDAGVLTYEYEFGPNAKANAFAARTRDGKMMIISPPCKVTEGVFEDVAEFGPVGALVPNNGFHHFGLAEWKRRFPNAWCFADEKAAKRIHKKNPDAPELRPISELRGLLGEGVWVNVVSDSKCGELWAVAKTGDGYAWYTSDLLCNLPRMPDSFPVRMLFKLTGTKTGFGVFHTAMNFTVKDKKGTLRALQRDMAERRPTTVVPAHGPILREPGLAQRADQVIAAAL